MQYAKQLLSSFLIVIFFMFVGTSLASANSEPSIQTKETHNSIELSWDLEGEYFEVYRDQELVWSGKESFYVDSNLEVDHLYSYRVGSYDESKKLIDINNVKTKTTDNKISLLLSDSNDISTKLVTTVGMDYVKLEWGQLKTKNGEYKIYRDDKLIGTTKNLSYSDTNVEPGHFYTYKIEAKKEVSPQEKEDMKLYIKENGLKLSKSELEELFLVPHVLIRTVETNKEVSHAELLSKDLPTPVIESGVNSMNTDDSISMMNIKYSFLFRYTTFIPEKTVKNPNPLDGGYLGGDDRSWGFFNNKFRTRSDVYAGWAGGINELKQTPSVKESILYSDAAGTKVIKRATASTTGIKLTKDLISSSKMMWRVNHNIGVPFAEIYPDITYYYEGILHSNYSLSLRGSHDRAPNHEFAFTLAYTEDTPISIFNFEGQSFFNLIPGAPQTYFEYSM